MAKTINQTRPISSGRQNAPGTAGLLQAVPQELQEPDHVLMPYEHRYSA